MNILEKRCTKTNNGHGMVAYDAEAKVEVDGEILFAHVNYYDGAHFTIDTVSMYDYMTGVTQEKPDSNFKEYYEELDEAKKSQFYAVFVMLDKMIDDYIAK